MAFVPAIHAADVPPGQCRTVCVEGRWLAVCNDAGRFFACDNECPHAGGSLGHGDVAHGKVICPVHRWPWDLTTGRTADQSQHLRVRGYPTKLQDGMVQVELDGQVGNPAL